MIAYAAVDAKYFDLYFDLWADQLNRFYPNMRKIIAVHQLSDIMRQRAQEKNVELRPATLPNNPGRPHFYLLRWLNLPWQENDLILETQINCLAVRTQLFNKNQTVDHLRIARPKRNTTGGVSAAVFKPAAARAIVQQAQTMLANPPDGDHPMNSWQSANLSWEKSVTEQQFKTKQQSVQPWCCWVTAGTSQHYAADQKLEILRYYIGLEL